MGRAAAISALAAAAALAAGCGLGPGRAPTDVQMTVTRDFGARALLGARAPKVRGAETVMSLLMRNSTVSTRYGGGFVQSIDGLSGGHEGGRPVDWFFYVNGVEATKGAAAMRVHPGDRIWWDRHDWSQADAVPAVVGSFPEPFLAGMEGKRLPVRVECTQPAASSCHTVLDRLRARGVPAALAAPSGAYEPLTLRVLVGPYRSIVADLGAGALREGPAASGVYGRFAQAGSQLALLDADGRVRRTLGAGAGLVAATRRGEDAPVWIVTGTDAAGVGRAAQALRQATLQDRFALAVGAHGEAIGLPDQSG